MLNWKITRTIVIVLLAGAPSLCRSQCRWGPPSPRLPIGLTLSIRFTKPLARIPEPVIIHIELSNQSDTTVSMTDMMWPLRDYDIRLYDAEGKQVPYTEYGRKMRTGPIQGSSKHVEIAPGEKLTFDEDLSVVYAVPLPGTYTAEACRELNKWGNIYSNKAIIPFTN